MAHIGQKEGKGSVEDLQKGLQNTTCLRWPYFFRGDAEWRIAEDEMSSDATRARCRQMPVVRCHRVPDAARCQLPDAPPPGPAGAWGRSVERQSWCPLPRSRVTCCRRQCWGPPGCDDERRAPAVKSGVPLLSMSPVQRFCSALSFHQRVLQTFHLRPLGRRPGRLPRRLSPPAAPRSQTSTAANRRFRPWRPAAAATAAVAAGWTSFWEQLTPCCQRSTPAVVPTAVRPRRRSPDPHNSASGALAGKLPQFWSIIYFNLCQ